MHLRDCLDKVSLTVAGCRLYVILHNLRSVPCEHISCIHFAVWIESAVCVNVLLYAV